MLCSQSVSGSSLLSGYNVDDLREADGYSRHNFEQIDAVLYDEETAKRSSIKKICDEWSNKPHFRIRGHLCSVDVPTISMELLSCHRTVNPPSSSIVNEMKPLLSTQEDSHVSCQSTAH
jgi:hypothetical protein